MIAVIGTPSELEGVIFLDAAIDQVSSQLAQNQSIPSGMYPDLAILPEQMLKAADRLLVLPEENPLLFRFLLDKLDTFQILVNAAVDSPDHSTANFQRMQMIILPVPEKGKGSIRLVNFFTRRSPDLIHAGRLTGGHILLDCQSCHQGNFQVGAV